MKRKILILAILILSTTGYGQTERQYLPSLKVSGPSLSSESGSSATSRSVKQLKIAPDSVISYTLTRSGLRIPGPVYVYNYTDKERTQVKELIRIEAGYPYRALKYAACYGQEGQLDSIREFEKRADDFEHRNTTVLQYDARGRVVELSSTATGKPFAAVRYAYNPEGQITAIHKQKLSLDLSLKPEYSLVNMHYDELGTLTDYDLHQYENEADTIRSFFRNTQWYGVYQDNIISADKLDDYGRFMSPDAHLPVSPQHYILNSPLSFDEYPEGASESYIARWELNGISTTRTLGRVTGADTTYTHEHYFYFDEEGQMLTYTNTLLEYPILIHQFTYTFNEWGFTEFSSEYYPGTGTRRSYINYMIVDNFDQLKELQKTTSIRNGDGNKRVEVFEFYHTDATTSTTDQPVQAPLHIFPNPASEYIQIDIPYPAHIHLDLFNAAGAIVLSSQWQHTGGFHRIDIDRLPAGVYLARIRSGGETRTATFVKK